MWETANMWEHKVGINANIANLVYCENPVEILFCKSVNVFSHTVQLRANLVVKMHAINSSYIQPYWSQLKLIHCS